MGVKHRMPTDGQPHTVSFTVFAQLCGPKANETEMGATLFPKNGEGRNFDFENEMRFQKKLLLHVKVLMAANQW